MTPPDRAWPWGGVVAEYRDRLPVPADVPVITLGEGGTPLLPAPVLSDLTGCRVSRGPTRPARSRIAA
jgi:threonine synthase